MACNIYWKLMKILKLIFTASVIVLLLISCNSNRKSSGNSVKSENPVLEATGTIEKNEGEKSPAREIYDKYCLTCHQSDGSGVPGMYPPLVKAEKITGPADELIRVILFGLEGPIEPDGVTYAQVMPAQDFISDSDITLLVNYLRESWGEGGGEISVDDVKRIRESGNF